MWGFKTINIWFVFVKQTHKKTSAIGLVVQKKKFNSEIRSRSFNPIFHFIRRPSKLEMAMWNPMYVGVGSFSFLQLLKGLNVPNEFGLMDRSENLGITSSMGKIFSVEVANLPRKLFRCLFSPDEKMLWNLSWKFLFVCWVISSSSADNLWQIRDWTYRDGHKQRLPLYSSRLDWEPKLRWASEFNLLCFLTLKIRRSLTILTFAKCSKATRFFLSFLSHFISFKQTYVSFGQFSKFETFFGGSCRIWNNSSASFEICFVSALPMTRNDCAAI